LNPVGFSTPLITLDQLNITLDQKNTKGKEKKKEKKEKWLIFDITNFLGYFNISYRARHRG